MVPTLGYWDMRGLASPIRYLLEYTKTPYEERRYKAEGPPTWSRKDWTDEKETLGLDFPNLPYLIDGNVKLTQSCAILRYIARKHDLCGKTDQERASVDMMEHEIYDFKEGFVELCYSGQDGFEGRKANYLKGLSAKLQRFEKFLGTKHWLAGEHISFPDFFFYEVLKVHTLFEESCLKEFPALHKYIERFEHLPEIAAYMKSDKFIERPCNNPSAAWK